MLREHNKELELYLHVTYDEPSGIATVFTETNHNLSAGDPITLSGIAFTCSGKYRYNYNHIPRSTMQSYTVSMWLVDQKEFSALL